MKILYVEDDTAMRKTVEIMLRTAGYDFDSASCGQEALDRASKEAYDLILLDIMLPDIDGYEVIGRLRHAGIKTRFLLQTGLLERGKKANTESLGTTACLIKPFDKTELVERIERMRGEIESDGGVDPHDGEATGAPIATERRQHRRFSTVKAGWLLADKPLKIVVLNMSYGGAAIRLPSEETQLPPKFSIAFESSPEIQCELCWRTGNKIGVKFIY